MRRIRVLVVDDSSVVRLLLTECLTSDPDIDFIGAVGSGAVALAKLKQNVPDVITLDVEMPGMSGLDVLVELRKDHPHLPVIMFSSLTQRAAATTLDALARGATDYVTKPAGLSREQSAAHVRQQLLGKIRALALPSVPRPSMPAPRRSAPPRATRRPEILALGSSTGGPNALAAIFQEMPMALRVPIVIVQHMPPLFTQLLAERLSATCSMVFREAKNGDRLEAGKALIAPGDHHMRVVRDGGQAYVTIDQSPPESSCRPAVDVLFRSVADAYGAGTLAVMLTGMGQDGLIGCEKIHAEGGRIVVQDEASSVVWGMPGFVANAGLAEEVLPLDEIAGNLLRRIDTTITQGARHAR